MNPRGKGGDHTGNRGPPTTGGSSLVASGAVHTRLADVCFHTVREFKVATGSRHFTKTSPCVLFDTPEHKPIKVKWRLEVEDRE